jgi:hypothetical protein
MAQSFDRKSENRIWLILAVLLSVLAVLDLFVIAGESIAKDLPHSVRCQLVGMALSIPLANEYKSHEQVIRGRTSCPN